jgi:hypothetical protein
MTDSLMENYYIERLIVSGYELGLYTKELYERFIKILKGDIKLKWLWRWKLYNNIKLELFVWIWVMMEYHVYLYISKESIINEEYLFREINRIYFDKCTREGGYAQGIYKFYHDYILTVINTSREDYEGVDYDNRVKEKLTRVFSLRIMNCINPEIAKTRMDVSEIIERFGNDLYAIQDEAETIFYLALDYVVFIIKEANKDVVSRSFDKLRTTKLVKGVIEDLKNL